VRQNPRRTALARARNAADGASPDSLSENGPREGTRDLPRSGPETGHRAVEADSPAGVAYDQLAQSLRRRRAELAALMESGRTASDVARSYQADHPLEPVVTLEEIATAVDEAQAARRKRNGAGDRRSRRREMGPRA
jgi:hypothetical protein